MGIRVKFSKNLQKVVDDCLVIGEIHRLPSRLEQHLYLDIKLHKSFHELSPEVSNRLPLCDLQHTTRILSIFPDDHVINHIHLYKYTLGLLNLHERDLNVIGGGFARVNRYLFDWWINLYGTSCFGTGDPLFVKYVLGEIGIKVNLRLGKQVVPGSTKL